MQIKKDERNMVENTTLLQIQDKERNAIRPRVIFYYQKILTYSLFNISTKLKRINSSQRIMVRVIPNL